MFDDARAVVHTASVAAGAIAWSPIPFSDAALLVPIQTTMVMKIYDIYGEEISEGMVTGIIEATTATSLGKSLVGNALKWFPGVGTVVGGLLNGGVSVTLTEIIGNTLIKRFEEGSSVSSEDLIRLIKNAIEEVMA